MGKRHLIDSNVIIDYTSSRLPQNGSDFVEKIFNNDFLISVATKIEVLGFDDVPDKMKGMEEFVSSAMVLALDEMVTQQTILLRRKYKKLKLGDAIIAATALVHNLEIISRNLKDFDNIESLTCINPYDL
jgi:predicted nucleic acid-binding protein